MNINQVFDNYLNFLLLYRRKGTYEAYKKTFVLLETILSDLKITDTNQFNTTTFDKMVKWLRENTDKKNSKINSAMAEFMTVLRFNNIKIPFKSHVLTDDTTSYKALNKSELIKLIEYLNSLDINNSNNLSWVTTIYLMLDTGVRKSEAMNIRTEDIDITQKIIYLKTTKTTQRVVKYGALSEPYINELLKLKKPYLIWNQLKDQKISRSSLERFFIKVNKNLKLSSGNVHPHRLRKTFATQLYLNGCPLPTIQKLLGHTDIKMTMIYLDIDSFTVFEHYSKFYPY